MNSLPTLVMLAGLPGTGKSTIARLVASQLGWPVLDKDIINTTLLDTGMPQSQAGPLAYEITLTLVEDILIHQKQSLILDTAGRQPFILKRAQAMTHTASARLIVNLVSGIIGDPAGTHGPASGTPLPVDR